LSSTFFEFFLAFVFSFLTSAPPCQTALLDYQIIRSLSTTFPPFFSFFVK